MNLHLSGHGERYAVEQCLLAFFPDERPVFPPGPPAPDADGVESRLLRGAARVTAVTVIRLGGRVSRGAAYAPAGAADDAERTRAWRYALKLSFYRAACRATGRRPPWGALTGIRPAGVALRVLRAGGTRAQADRLLRDRHRVFPRQRFLCMEAAEAARAAEATLAPRDVSIYVGVPFCPTRCAYCTFVSHSVEKAGALLPAFVRALVREIEVVGALCRSLSLRPVALYIGGGTPTTLSAAQLGEVTAALAARFDLTALREYSVEAGRPDTVDAEKLAVLRGCGVTRVSVNPQSMRDNVLAAVGRPHTAADVRAAYVLVRRAGFPVVNMDLIAGLPGDTPTGFAASVAEVLAMDPENVTLHTLARKRGARLTRPPSRSDGIEVISSNPSGFRISPSGSDSVETISSNPPGFEISPSGSDSVETMLTGAYDCLAGAGYRAYYLYRQKYMAGQFENTGWAKPGAVGLYNICMMEELHTVIALGGGGVTKLVDPARGRIERVFNPKYPYEYLADFERVCENKARIRRFYETCSNPR
ncbi:MAG: coproporphyrinogen dehydrogenase HemZ [Oscillospiraceae bacterium]|nr:coproporphyrinogen dehydrogenase HemZ [Oscillospiraceae bacterium]